MFPIEEIMTVAGEAGQTAQDSIVYDICIDRFLRINNDDSGVSKEADIM